MDERKLLNCLCLDECSCRFSAVTSGLFFCLIGILFLASMSLGKECSVDWGKL